MQSDPNPSAVSKKPGFFQKNKVLVIGAACWMVGCLCGGLMMAGGQSLTSSDSKPSSTPKSTTLSNQSNQPGPAKQAEPVEPAKPLPTYTSYPTYTPLPAVEPEIVFVTPTLLPDWQLMQTFTGTGKFTTDFFNLPAGMVRIKWDYVGDDNFAFSLKRLDNDSEELLENTIGNSNGQKILNIGASDRYVIDVMYGDGAWTITVEFMP